MTLDEIMEFVMPFLSCLDRMPFNTCKALRGGHNAAAGPTCIVVRNRQHRTTAACTSCKGHWIRHRQACGISVSVSTFIAETMQQPGSLAYLQDADSFTALFITNGYGPTTQQIVELALNIETTLQLGGLDEEARSRAKQVRHSFRLIVLLSLFIAAEENMKQNQCNYHAVKRCWRAGRALHEHLFTDAA